MTENHEAGERRHTIGDVARATGVSVRTLHHYEEIGLVTAGERTRSGHRRYTEADLRKVRQVRALRGLGLSLDDIATVFTHPAGPLTPLRDLLDVRLAEIELSLARLARTREQITGLLEVIDRPGGPEPGRFLTALESMAVYETYFAEELRDELARRRAEIGEETLAGLRDEWLELMRETRRHAQEGTPVGDPRVRTLVARWEALRGRLRGRDGHAGDDRLYAAGRALWRDHAAEIGESLAVQVPGFTGEDMKTIMDYLSRAYREHGAGRADAAAGDVAG